MPSYVDEICVGGGVQTNGHDDRTEILQTHQTMIQRSQRNVLDLSACFQAGKNQQHRSTTINIAMFGRRTLIFYAWLVLLCPAFNFALEATWTPNEADSVDQGGDGGPLPVSLAQRKQLLELEAAIVQSQDPQATLSHVAQQNGMTPQDLAGMLNRNRKDLEESGQLQQMQTEVDAAIMQGQGAGGGRPMSATLPRRILGLVVSILVGMMKTAAVQISSKPKQSTILASVLFATFLVSYNAPRNGIAVFPPFSSGHTTILQPPNEYLQDYFVNKWTSVNGWENSPPAQSQVASKKKGSKSKKQSLFGVGMTSSLEIDTASAEEDVKVESTREEDGFSLVATAYKLIPTTSDSDDEDDLEQEYMQESVKSIFLERKFSEFIPVSSQPLKFRSFLVATEGSDGDDDVVEGALMVMKMLGDFGRYGVEPMCFSYELEEDEDDPMTHCVAYHTLKGGHFDGEIKFSVEQTEEGIVVSVTLAIPQGGRAPPERLAKTMVSSLTESIVDSSRIHMKQTLSRRNQSQQYRARASGSASLKRHLRYEQEKNQEEMAKDRKRKWKRNNPDAGRYRPTGHRPPSGSGPAYGF